MMPPRRWILGFAFAAAAGASLGAAPPGTSASVPPTASAPRSAASRLPPAAALHPVAADAGGFEASLQDAAEREDASGAATPDAEKVWSSCLEHVPEGATRPKLTETFPDKGLAGWSLPLRLQLEHGLGEKVLPNGFAIHRDSDAARALEEAGFTVPILDAGAAPVLSREQGPERATTTVVIPFVALPSKPGRHELQLPPIPIAVSRASGELLTLCTQPHRITLEEPIANETEPAPKENPPPRPQREVWTLARDLTVGLLIGAAVATLLALLIAWWRRRPRPAPPPPPPRPPWEVAFEELDLIRRAGLVEAGQLADHLDRVSDTVRRYLGGRYGFEGIESTTDEVLSNLRKLAPNLAVFDDVRRMLQDCDLVKFARLAPTASDCSAALEQAERIVHSTMPALPRPGEEPPKQPLERNAEGGS